MGVTPGREFQPKPRSADRARIEDLLDGTIRQTESGSFYEVLHTHPPETRRGPLTLDAWQTQDRAALASIGDLDPARLPDPERFIFLDTETTGLGGAGAIPFLVGVGTFNEAGHFTVRQFFLRDPAEEEALLVFLHDFVAPDSALVTFNGRQFDVPLLAGRYILARRATHIRELPNLDLLLPARRLWRRRLSSCALGSLEFGILDVHRSQADVPSYLIPAFYQQYLATGDAREMARVFYHNEQDILSMVSLAAILARAFSQPAEPDLPVDDRISLARWYDSRGMIAECEAAYRLAVDEALDESTRRDALEGYAMLLKRLQRRAEAVSLWEFLADLKMDILGHEELAKYYEWHTGDPAQALRWAEAGIALAESWQPGLSQVQALASLKHRRERLIRKLAGKADPADPNIEN